MVFLMHWRNLSINLNAISTLIVLNYRDINRNLLVTRCFLGGNQFLVYTKSMDSFQGYCSLADLSISQSMYWKSTG